ncbi:MAG: segregation/condensation protein A [Nitrospiraceae bacterium]|nr:MAG: segregation/condensation protein A [Nitrospiraceae bacterium]
MPEVLEEAITLQNDLKESSKALLPDPGRDSGSINGFHFKLPVFEGPLDLLLHLIRENKIDIYDIPIVDITRQYMVYIELMKELNLEIAGEFLVMAATLIHIKSRTILPPAEEEVAEPEEDPRSELVRRLLEYQAYKESSISLRKREEIWKNVFCRDLPDRNDYEFEPEPVLFEANVFDLITAFQKMLEKAPEQNLEITRETLTVADRINYIVERIEHVDGVRFENLFEEGCTKVTLLVTFLAVLEVVRLGLIKIYQERAFGLIWLMNPRKQGAQAPEKTHEESLTDSA